MIPPNWIDATDLNSWANRRDAQGKLPQLLRRLIHATVPRLQRIRFPAGESVQMGGWDGIIETSEGNAFVPDGCSVWELGVNRKVKGKADDDYQKRCADSLGLTSSETTFVFVTPRRWGGKDDWIRAKNSEGIWAEVIAYDADDIEQWLELAPAVHIWLALLLGKWSENDQDIGSFWDEWVNVTTPCLTSTLHLAGREQNVEKVKNWLNEPPSKLTIQANSIEEAIAFFTAIIYDLPEDERVQFLSRCVLVKNESSWRYFASSQDSLILIPTFERLKSIPQEHHVLVSVGREISPSKDTLQLSRLSREGFRKALASMGFSLERADALSQESKRSLLVLRRLLASNPEIHTPDWAKPENARSLIPVLLAGAWDETREADKEAIAALARKTYQEVINDILRWLNTSDPPIRKLGNVWQLVSREVTWHFISHSLVRDDFEILETTVLSVLGTLDPKYELPIDQQFAASVYGKNLPHSNFLREGLAETLAILATRGIPSEIQDITTAQSKVNVIIRKLLNTDSDWQQWASLSYLLPTLAEAAPEVFLEVVEQELQSDFPTLLGLFQESRWALGGSPHTGLLWALETFAWKPIYLSRVTLILAKLSRLDPGGHLVNRPFNSLCEIFFCWKPQTSAPLQQRLRVIDTLLIREPEVAWNLLCNLLPKITGELSHPIYKPRWREWLIESRSKVTCTEYWQNIEALIQRILTHVGSNSNRLCDVIERIESLQPSLRDRVIDFIASIDTANIPDRDIVKAWGSLRKIIQKHKKYSNAKWAMQTEVIEQLESIYENLEPHSLIFKYAWLFSVNPPLSDSTGFDWKTRDKKIKQVRHEAVKEIYFKLGISALLDLAIHVKEPGLLGASIGWLEAIDKDEIQLLNNSLGQHSKVLHDFGIEFIRGRLGVSGWSWAEKVISLAKSGNWPKKQLLNFFHGLPFEQGSWDLLSLFDEKFKTTYWQTISAIGVKLDDCKTAVCRLLSVNRPYAALNLAALYLNNQSGVVSIQPRILVEILEKAALIDPLTEIPTPGTQLLDHYIEQIFYALDASESVEENEIARLELIYFYWLRNSKRQPKLLHQELASNPLFFAEIVKLVYKSEDNQEESVKFDEATVERARMNYELLESLYQVPGLTEDGNIDSTKLRDWVLKAREACQESGRGAIGDHHIGELLAYAPKASDGLWPDIAVREIIEEIASRDIELGIETGVYNLRGVWSKSIGEGGIQERQLAETYRDYADAIVDTYPQTASMLYRIANDYDSVAHGEDIQAELRD
ncbi:hypothetical protein IQ249_00635 [Lusitaniella coriacea LEGE 07157]|uniref:Uncharacterized protein n=1 Tax=Lusitaniella coriacea LEGE 07157 TaxID=945747 RepID=A0A8J7B6H3_9CYAN|nr:hypothetical protein [Lusitaniella coriacea]MBE9114394.1 hypothetical protein [Lusitaniella coriacea LEGE 07157]